MDKPTVWYVNVFVSDFEKSLHFYTEQLGLEPIIQDKSFGYASFKTEGAGFAIAAVAPDADNADLVGRHTGIGWGVENLQDTYQSLLAKGVRFSAPPQRQPWGGHMALMLDPDDNVFYLDEFRKH